MSGGICLRGKNHYLYIDTSDHLVLGLLDENLEFLDLLDFPETKSSAIIHQNIFDLFQRHQASPLALKGVIQAAGPGSYTGVRLSYGIVQIFKWHGVACYGFYHFEVPLLLGVQEGGWISKAFKGEVFSFSWEGKKQSSSLFSEEQFLNSCVPLPISTHFPGSLDEKIVAKFSPNSTHQMIVERPSDFFRCIIENKLSRKPYYFRPLQKEFRRPNI